MFNDPLASATAQLLKSVKAVTAAIKAKAQVIRDAEAAIKEAQGVIQQAKDTLSGDFSSVDHTDDSK